MFKEIYKTNVMHMNSKLLCMCTAGLDDMLGNRTIEAIPNVNGIVKFSVGQGHVKSITPQTWNDIGIEEHYEVLENRHARTHTFCS